MGTEFAANEPQSVLSAAIVEAVVHVEVAGTHAAARVQANWARVGVTVTEPAELAGVKNSYSRRGFIFAVACQADPALRFADGQRLTPPGARHAEQMLKDLVGDYHVTHAHAQPIARLWIDAMDRIAKLEGQREAVIDPQERRVLRDRLRAGELDQGQYQALRRQLVERDAQRHARCAGLAQRARMDFAAQTQERFGRELELPVAAQMLQLPVIGEQLAPSVRERIESLTGSHKDTRRS